jgi:hypothetical protein
MKYLKTMLLLLVIPLLAVTAFPQDENEDPGTVFVAPLRGPEETPSILSQARGRFKAVVSDDGTSMDYTLTYDGFLTAVAVAHIHIGQKGFPGGVTIFLCGGGGRPACPSPGGTVTGTIKAADVGAIPAQELAAGDLPKVLRAMRAGLTYVNVHTMAHGGGEIRGQIRAVRDDEDEE